jgi:uncharacterized protein
MHLFLFNSLGWRLRAPEIVVTGEGSGAEALVMAALALPALDRIVLRARSADALPPTHAAQDKIKATHEPAAFVCVGERCSLPVTEPARIAEVVNQMRT